MYKIDYDKVSKIYDKVRLGDPIVVQKILEEIFIDESSMVLDIGCGTGNNSVLISDVTNACVYGIDRSEGMLEKAKAKNPKIHFVLGDAVTLNAFEDNCFDVAFMVDVIHHIRNIDTMFKNIFRVLKKDGGVFIFTESHEQIKNNRLVSRYFPETIEAELKRYQSTDEIFESLKNNGFRDIKLKEIHDTQGDNAGERLLSIAETKGYSMFHLISDEAIKRGIDNLKHDLLTKKIIKILPKSSIIVGRK